MKITKKQLTKIIKEELTAIQELGPETEDEAPNEFDQILNDPDIPMGDKAWLRMLDRVSGERMAVRVFRSKQAEESGFSRAARSALPMKKEDVLP